MNLGAVRDIVRRRVHDEDSSNVDRWTNARLNTLINLSLGDAQRAITALDPDEFAVIWTAPITADKRRIPLPAGFHHELAFETKASASGDYSSLGDPYTYKELLKLTSTDEQRYGRVGRYFMLGPVPGTTISAGIRVTFVKTLTVTVDTDVPAIHVDLHEILVDRTVHKALKETEEDSKVAQSYWKEVIKDILPNSYRKTVAGNPRVSVSGIDKDY